MDLSKPELTVLLIQGPQGYVHDVCSVLKQRHVLLQCTVTTASTWQQSLQNREFAFVFCDYELGGGLLAPELAIQLRSAGVKTPLVAIADARDDLDRLRKDCLSSGIDEIVSRDDLAPVDRLLNQFGNQTAPQGQQARAQIAVDVTSYKKMHDELTRTLTETQRTTEALTQSEQQLRALFDHALDAIVVLDDDGNYVDANPAACSLFCLPKHELIGKNVRDFVPDPENVESRWSELMRLGSRRFQCPLCAADGTRSMVEISATANFVPGRHLGYLRDITRSLELEEQVRTTSKLEAIGRLAGGVAHDFNNLLMVISSYSELASSLPAGGEEKMAGYLREIQKACQKAASLTQQLLAFSRKQVLAPAVLNVNSVITESKTLFDRLLGKDLQLITALDPELWQVTADRSQIEQLIMNLAVNARDAMPNGGILRISTFNVVLKKNGDANLESLPPGRYVAIEVEDNGVGMPKSILTQIFEPFFTTKSLGQGTGLGLSTVYGITKQSGGVISVKSDTGKGSLFRVLLPATGSRNEVDEPQMEPAPDHFGHETVLVVDDEPTMLDAVAHFLKSKGYHVLSTTDPLKAVELARASGKVEILLTDVVMPRMNGKEVAQRIRELHPDMQTVFMTGYTDLEALGGGSWDQGEMVLRKPFRLDTLLQTLSKAGPLAKSR